MAGSCRSKPLVILEVVETKNLPSNEVENLEDIEKCNIKVSRRTQKLAANVYIDNKC